MHVKKIRRKKEIVTIVGLGYVGLPLAVLAYSKGYKVYGVAKDRKKIQKLNRGINILPDAPELAAIIAKKAIQASNSFDVAKKSNVVIVCVPTPVDKFYNPDLGPVISASKGIAKNLKKGQLIIIESTINPGVCEEVVMPILEATGLRAGKDFDLAHCPERINPGDPKWHVGNIPRCVGAITRAGALRAAKFYRSIIDGQVRVMKSIKEAEATKIVENSFRDVNIAFVNELALSFDKLGIDVYDVLQGSATKPFAFMAHFPSIGVGGHCIPVDPYYLIERARLSGFDHKFLKLAREINNHMPYYCVKALQRNLNELKMSVKGARVGILGLSYKANVGDIRESPSKKVIEYLKNLGADVHIFDPYFPDHSTEKTLESVMAHVDAIILATNHRMFIEKLTPAFIKKYKIKVVIDGKNALDKDGIIARKILYKGVGR
ncbi:MAG: nucleotide sugar dehydrogenase [Patescibacteria group bacterium]|jgi:nucleotide sugar dehydrogenase